MTDGFKQEKIKIKNYTLIDGEFIIPEQEICNDDDFVFTLQGNSYKIKIHFIYKDANDITLELKNNKIAFKILGQIQNNISIRGFDFINNDCVQMHIVNDKIILNDNAINTHSITFYKTSFSLNIGDAVNNSIMLNKSTISCLGEISFFSNGLLRHIYIDKSQDINVKYQGMIYKLPFQEGWIEFNANGEIKTTYIEDSPERSAIVYSQRLNKLEKSQEQTNQEVKELQRNHEVATRWDWGFVVVFILISVGLFCFAYFGKPMIGDPVSFVRKNPDINKYVFLFEILKRTPIIVSLVVAFKFLQLAFERIRQVGEVEKVQKYLKLTDNDDVKNNLLGIIAVPFFTHKKQKQPLLDRLVEKNFIKIKMNEENNKNTSV